MKDTTGICVECEAPFKHCLCDPCQHGHQRTEHCIFCQGELVIEEVKLDRECYCNSTPDGCGYTYQDEYGDCDVCAGIWCCSTCDKKHKNEFDANTCCLDRED